MPNTSLEEQLTKYLTDVHSIEVQAIAQLELAPRIARDERLVSAFRDHLEETRGQEHLIRERLEARGADTSTLKDIAGRIGGWAMIAFARLNPDTPGKLTAHAFSYEHMELAAYELLRRIAQRAGEQPVVDVAVRIASQERAMAERLAASFDHAVEASLRDKDANGIETELVKYLRDAHSIEAQAIQLLEAGPQIAELEPLAALFRTHLDESREHQRLVAERLEAHNAGPSRFQSGAMRVGALNIGGFFKAQPDSPVKIAGFAYAFEHLEIAGYELLRRVAARADDDDTVTVAQRILGEERAMVDRITGTWDAAVDAAVAQQVALS